METRVNGSWNDVVDVMTDVVDKKLYECEIKVLLGFESVACVWVRLSDGERSGMNGWNKEING